MKKFKEFLMEDSDEMTFAGFRVRPPKPHEDEFFSNNRHIAGWYGSGNVNDDEEEGTIVINPYNEHMKDPNKREGLKALEAVRGIYKISPEILDSAPDLTPEQDKNLEFYTQGSSGKNLSDLEKKNARKATFYSRMAVNDTLNPMGGPNAKEPTITPEQRDHVDSELAQHLMDKNFYFTRKPARVKADRYEAIKGMGDIA